jgi:single-stranded DNA-binding protein
MKDINEFHCTGKVETFKRIETRTGLPMASITVLCWKERVKVVLFKELAQQTELSAGDRVEVKGSIQSTSWTDQNGQQRHGWQVIAHEIRKGDEADQQQEAPRQPAQQEQAPTPAQQHDNGSRFAYRGGPF